MSKVEVYLNDHQIQTLKSLLDQSQMGVHLLFDNQQISKAFKENFSEDDFFEADNIKQVQDSLALLLQKKNLNDKKNYVASLNEDDQKRLIRAYFYIIENKSINKKNKASLH